MSQDLSPEAISVVAKVEKLLRLAGKNTNEHEAAAATAKAMELLAEHNLDMSIIEQGGGEKSKRSDEKMKGGLYHYQRELWEAVAQLNFCLYWNQYNYDPEKTRRKKIRGYWGPDTYETVKGGYVFQHRVVGRQINVVATRNMAGYLEQTIERLTREKLHGEGSQFFTNWAMSYREGMSDGIIEKINEERELMIKRDQKRAKAAEARARAAAASGASTSTALSVEVMAKSEEDANMDFLYGEGYSAKQAAREAKWAEEARIKREEYTKWAAANPEEARKKEEERYKQRRRSSWNAGTGRDRTDNIDYGAYRAGKQVGEKISIRVQTEGKTKSSGSLK